ncbi:MAG TPA: hypothetical protein VJT08_11635 [Terriglobales bacterium]|nr:hypothetical protein [Acidobacteriaceae bacterium]HKR31125.1 hypothetical protein [Terriglobales bacterium]
MPIQKGRRRPWLLTLAQQKKSARDPNIGRKLPRLTRRAGFAVGKMSASYEVISDFLAKIGPAFAEQLLPRALNATLNTGPKTIPSLLRWHGAKRWDMRFSHSIFTVIAFTRTSSTRWKSEAN